MKGCNGDETEGLKNPGVGCVVVAPSYGRVLRPVSNKDSLRWVKLSAGKHVICLSGRSGSISTRPVPGRTDRDFTDAGPLRRD